MALHDDEVEITAADVHRLISAQAPHWSGLCIDTAGNGTDNRMFRLGDELLVRLPIRPGTAEAVDKEQRWLPWLAPQLPLPIPEAVFRGRPDEHYPFEWSVLRWIEGAEPADATVTDWREFGIQLGGFVEALHSIEIPAEVEPAGSLQWYRGRPLREFTSDGFEVIEEVRQLARTESIDLDLDAVTATWRELTEIADPPQPDVWLHGDLRTANLLARDGKLAAVIDFGALSIGNPTAEHAAVWQLPVGARQAYRERSGVDDGTWQRARGWAILVSLLALPYYWHSWPEFARDGIGTINQVLSEPG
ncbi:aminoglycoside phosphotransferase family protein [Yimella sp. cx-573]|nr:aminoglycoside phosphotransferase family protein [Yimella sp. cx-573]